MNNLTEEQIDIKIEAWHNGDGEGMELYEYLGVSQEEYAQWIQSKTNLFVEWLKENMNE
jgi:hypothetical protein